MQRAHAKNKIMAFTASQGTTMRTYQHIKRRAAVAGINLSTVMERAGMARSTAFRWDQGAKPRQASLTAMSDALDAIIAERQAALAKAAKAA